MVNFCTTCGTRLGKDDNFCSNCGAKVDKSYNPDLDTIEKRKAKQKLNRMLDGKYNTFGKTLEDYGLDYDAAKKAIRQQVEKEIDSGQITSGGVELRVNQLILEYKAKMEKEKEEEKKKLKMIDGIFESEEIKSEIRRNNIGQEYVIFIKDCLDDRIFDKKENMSEDEIKHFIRAELKKAVNAREKAKIKKEKARIAKEKEMSSKKIEKDELTNGGYCNLGCRHCFEEFLDSSGGIVGDFTAEGYVEYYCNLGHTAHPGRFCEDYE